MYNEEQMLLDIAGVVVEYRDEAAVEVAKQIFNYFDSKGLTITETKRTNKVKLCFTLTMPNVGSWNGQWSGRDNLYAIVRDFTGKKHEEKVNEMLEKKSFYYNFSDGWSANIIVTKIEGKEVSNIRKLSHGFCGYDWMVESIINKMEIKI